MAASEESPQNAAEQIKYFLKKLNENDFLGFLDSGTEHPSYHQISPLLNEIKAWAHELNELPFSEFVSAEAKLPKSEAKALLGYIKNASEPWENWRRNFQKRLADSPQNPIDDEFIATGQSLATKLHQNAKQVSIPLFIAHILNIDSEKVERKKQLGDIHALTTVKERFEFSQKCLRGIPSSFWINFGMPVLKSSEIYDLLLRFHRFTSEDVRKFTSGDKTSLEENIDNLNSEIMEHSKSILPLALSDQLESGQKISFTKEKEEIDSKIKEANELVEKAQVIATPKHTKEEAKRIGEVKEGYRIKARRWLIISVGLALFLLGASWMGWGPFGFQPPENNRAQLWNLFSTKAIFFTLSIGALYVCVRNYLAMQHNYVVNEHREEALLTYEQMQNLAGIKDARDIILTLVASSIYSAQDTGFTKSEVGGTQSQLPVINQVLAAVRQKTLKDD